LEHDQYAPVRSRARLGRPSGRMPEQGSTLGGNDAAALARIVNLSPGNVYGGR
jgi:hypothetical protein